MSKHPSLLANALLRGGGKCVDMPSEPPDSLFKTKVRIGAYPTSERGGMVWGRSNCAAA